MKFLRSAAIAALSCTSAVHVSAASAWSFEDATLSIQGKGAGVGGASKEKLAPNSPLAPRLTLSATDTLKVVLTATDGSTGKRPHQAFLTLHEPTTGLQESFPLTLKENGKGKVEVTQKDLPYQFTTTTQPLQASLVLASFGSSTPYNHHAFDLAIHPDSTTPPTTASPPDRYTPKPQIHHLFKPDPQSPPKLLSLVFALAIAATLPCLLGAWILLGGNLEHASKAFGASPVAHALFFGSIVAMEGVFLLYYTAWNLFQTLPVAAVVGTVAFVSGSRALTEVQDRRLAGER
ncbi:hypothetical protein EJ03DRAFT_389077 [Teratosphaeria nubilosa]|uniref:Ribophorin II C-terminal domain-containing protein n=1 Tax=Teratosphaeria nubilosa TaxID=161662 RepID=A0A6G1LD11_9PEZI|nr:hypothetical protein EJ03DRAFT_389077 [Teratosphaeria nubilosa]